MPTRHLIHRRPTLHGFTLIELLVVITIIVILLALLAPALDTAVHHALLAKCGANQRAILSGCHQYAMAQRRYYPARPQTRDRFLIRDLTHYDTAQRLPDADFRPVLQPYMPVNKYFNDPLLKNWDFETPPWSKYLLASYEMWFGESLPGGITRMGGQMRAQIDTDGNGSPDTTVGFRVLIKDQLLGVPPATATHSSHPDNTGVMVEATGEQENATLPMHPGAGTYSYYRQDGTPLERVELDLNVGFTDESVIRYARSRWDPVSKAMVDSSGARQYKLGFNFFYLPKD